MSKAGDILNEIGSDEVPRSGQNNRRNRANRELTSLTKNQYFDQVPVQKIADILTQNGYDADELDSVYSRLDRSDLTTEVTGNLHDRLNIQVGPKTFLILNWYKMDSGRYEVVVYLT